MPLDKFKSVKADGSIEYKVMHENAIADWLVQDFPLLTSPKGQLVLEERADEILKEFNTFFNQGFIERSSQLRREYFAPVIQAIRESYAQKNNYALSKALLNYISACDNL